MENPVFPSSPRVFHKGAARPGGYAGKAFFPGLLCNVPNAIRRQILTPDFDNVAHPESRFERHEERQIVPLPLRVLFRRREDGGKVALVNVARFHVLLLSVYTPKV